jgi:hypothetical protein
MHAKRHFIQVFDNHIPAAAELAFEIASRQKWKRRARPNSVNLEAVALRTLRRASPTRAQDDNLVPASRQSAKDFVEMNFRATGKGMIGVLEVRYENPHCPRGIQSQAYTDRAEDASQLRRRNPRSKQIKYKSRTVRRVTNARFGEYQIRTIVGSDARRSVRVLE